MVIVASHDGTVSGIVLLFHCDVSMLSLLKGAMAIKDCVLGDLQLQPTCWWHLGFTSCKTHRVQMWRLATAAAPWQPCFSCRTAVPLLVGFLQDPRAKLSRDLVALLADDYVPAQQLLKRIYPSGLLMYLAQRQPLKVPRRRPVRQPEPARLASHHHADTLAR